jgi:hypothetical protein
MYFIDGDISKPVDWRALKTVGSDLTPVFRCKAEIEALYAPKTLVTSREQREEQALSACSTFAAGTPGIGNEINLILKSYQRMKLREQAREGGMQGGLLGSKNSAVGREGKRLAFERCRAFHGINCQSFRLRQLAP